MTEPGKFAPGLKGFPTPNAADMSDAYLLFLFTDSTQAQWVLGALEPMVYEENWYQAGDMTPAEAAEVFRLIIEQAPYNLVGSDDIQAPFWDDEDGDDADDTEPAEDQEWYGRWDGESFTESLAYVLLTNFISGLVGTGAAIKFLTIPRAFRVAIRTNPHGAKLLAFMDGGLYAVINGYSIVEQVVETVIVSPGSELMLVVSDEHDPDATPNEDGEFVVNVVRGRLSADDVTPPNTRYYGTPPVYQTTTDGGVTWVDNPEADPRYNPAYLLPPMTPYSGLECDVAARMTAQLRDNINIMCEAADAAQAATALIGLFVLPTGLPGMLLDLFLAVCNWIIDNGQATILAAFTDAVYDDIQCILSCYIKDDGRITQESLDVAWDAVKAAHPGTVATVVDEVRFLFTDVTFTNAGVSRDETGDCSDCDPCDWFIEYDFTAGSTHDWGIYIDASQPYGSFSGGKFIDIPYGGFQKTLYLLKYFAGIEITGLSLFGQQFHGTGIGNFFRINDVTGTGDAPTTTLVAQSAIATTTPDTWAVVSAAEFTTTNGLGLFWLCDNNGTGYVQVKKIRISGTGAPPTDGMRVSGLT